MCFEILIKIPIADTDVFISDSSIWTCPCFYSSEDSVLIMTVGSSEMSGAAMSSSAKRNRKVVVLNMAEFRKFDFNFMNVLGKNLINGINGTF